MTATYELELPDVFDAAYIRANLYHDALPMGTMLTEGQKWGRANKLDPAGQRGQAKITAVGIDYQDTFVHAGLELKVDNADADCERFGRFVLRNSRVISQLVWTLDSHKIWHIFSPIFWVDSKGNHPDPLTAITAGDIEGGKWKVNPDAAWGVYNNSKYLPWLKDYVLHYCNTLESKGLPPLVIWPIHGRLGAHGHQLDPVLLAVSDMFAAARRSEADFQVKGLEPLSEMYSPFGHEVTIAHDGETEVGYESTDTIRQILESDAVIISGEAASHCVLRAMQDVISVIKKDDPTLAQKIYFLKDCTSPVPVPMFIDAANKALVDYEAAGVNVVESTTPMHEWPGIIAQLVA